MQLMSSPLRRHDGRLAYHRHGYFATLRYADTLPYSRHAADIVSQ